MYRGLFWVISISVSFGFHRLVWNLGFFYMIGKYSLYDCVFWLSCPILRGHNLCHTDWFVVCCGFPSFIINFAGTSPGPYVCVYVCEEWYAELSSRTSHIGRSQTKVSWHKIVCFLWHKIMVNRSGLIRRLGNVKFRHYTCASKSDITFPSMYG
jgi:hypothetical protein